jgi:hypothetical protein
MAVVSIRVSKIDSPGALKDQNADGREPNRISSSDGGRPDRFRLDQCPCPVLPGRRRTVVNCNPNCNHVSDRDSLLTTPSTITLRDGAP